MESPARSKANAFAAAACAAVAAAPAMFVRSTNVALDRPRAVRFERAMLAEVRDELAAVSRLPAAIFALPRLFALIRMLLAAAFTLEIALCTASIAGAAKVTSEKTPFAAKAPAAVCATACEFAALVLEEGTSTVIALMLVTSVWAIDTDCEADDTAAGNCAEAIELLLASRAFIDSAAK